MVPEPRVLTEPQDIPIPDAKDLVIELLTDQMLDFDESATDVLDIFAVTGRDKKRVEVNERKMTGEDRNFFRRAKGDRVAAVTGSQSVQRCEQEGGRQERGDESTMGVDMKVHRQSQGTPLCPGFSRPVDHCCPQLSFDLSERRRRQNDATIQDMFNLNKNDTICQIDRVQVEDAPQHNKLM